VQTGSVVLTFLPSKVFSEELEAATALAASVDQTTGQDTGHVTGQVTGQDKILAFCKQPKTAKEIMHLLGLTHRESFYNNYLKPLLQKQLLSMTEPTKPKSRNQRYFTREPAHFSKPIE